MSKTRRQRLAEFIRQKDRKIYFEQPVPLSAVRVGKKFGKVFPLLCLLASAPTAAQIAPDATLPRNSIVTPQANIIKIDGGTGAGNNLFHSFSQFSVPTGGTAFFNNAVEISNIFSRVTGGSVSNIDGILKANGTANLFLINPNGIIFGNNAQLNIGGSFVGTTANAIQFGNQGFFSAKTPNNPALLTINPSAFLFNQIAAQGTNSIENRGDFQVKPGKSLLLVGGNGGILIDGTVNGRLVAPGGEIAIGGLAAPGTIGLSIDAKNPDLMSLSFPSVGERVDVSLVNNASLDVRAGGGGSIAINARNLTVSGGSNVQAGIAPQSGAVDALAGDITIDATNLISVDNSTIANNVSSGGTGNGGNLNITGRTISVTNGAQLGASTFGQGNAGNLTISAIDGISFDGVGSDGFPSGAFPSGAFSSVEPGAVGNGGNLNITGRTISVTNGAQLSAGTFGQGNAGNLTISAIDGISFNGVSSNGDPSGAGSQVAPGAVGNGGNLNITGRTISVTNGAILDVGTFGQGNAGNLTITAIDGISFNGDGFRIGAFSSVASGAVGNGGNINITGRTISFTTGARLTASTFGQGNAGNLTISAIDGISFDGVGSDGLPSGAFSRVEPGAVGNGGNLNITGSTLSLTNGATVSTDTKGQGNAGNININVNSFNSASGAQVLATTSTNGSAGNINITTSDRFTLTGSNTGVFANTTADSTGKSGSIFINSHNAQINDGANVSVNSLGSGNGGNLVFQTNSLTLDTGGFLSAATASGEGGSITISGQDLLLLRGGSSISATAEGSGNGGNVTINFPFLVAVPIENSNITANAVLGKGGNIDITTQSIYGLVRSDKLTPRSDITASSEFGVNGTIQITTPGIDPSQALTVLPESIVD